MNEFTQICETFEPYCNGLNLEESVPDKLNTFVNLRVRRDVKRNDGAPDGMELFIGESGREIPFIIPRFYFSINYGAATSAIRGSHSHNKGIDIIFCIQGNVRVKLTDGVDYNEVTLDSPGRGIVVYPNIWHELDQYEGNTIVFVVSSKEFSEENYIRDYDKYIEHLLDLGSAKDILD